MLIRESELPRSVGAVVIMSDIMIVAASVKSTILEIAKQSSALGTGLQNAAPGEKTGTPNNSVQYLLSTADDLTKIAEELEKLLTVQNADAS